MKRPVHAGFAVLFFFLVLAVGMAQEKQSGTLTGKVVGIADGDTLTLLVGSSQYKVRLDGIDCPESGQPYGNKAKQALADRVFGKEVKVETHGKDKYGRTLGEVFLDNSVNTWLVTEGLAWHYKQYSKSKVLAEAEIEARQDRKGLWADSDAIAPWEWRQGEAARRQATTEQKNVNRNPVRKPVTIKTATTKPKENPPKVEPTVYVTKSGSKYHSAGCRYLSKSSIPMPLSDAIKRYSPCSVCRPPTR